MAQPLKTASAPLDVAVWLNGVDAARRDEAEALLALFGATTGWEPRLWGAAMIGFGRYAYRYASGHGGESFVVGFSPRKPDLSLYILPEAGEASALLASLGPHRAGKGCLYIRRLASVDLSALTALIRARVAETTARWPVSEQD